MTFDGFPDPDEVLAELEGKRDNDKALLREEEK